MWTAVPVLSLTLLVLSEPQQEIVYLKCQTYLDSERVPHVWLHAADFSMSDPGTNSLYYHIGGPFLTAFIASPFSLKKYSLISTYDSPCTALSLSFLLRTTCLLINSVPAEWAPAAYKRTA